MTKRSKSSTAGSTSSSFIVVLAGITIVAIALFQTATNGSPDKYTIGAVLALALGGGVGRVADSLVKSYVQSVIDSSQQKEKDESGS